MMDDPHAGKPIRCPYCGGREAIVGARVQGARVVFEAGGVTIPSLPEAVYVSEEESARCAGCDNECTFGAWLGIASHQPADVA